MEFKLKDTSFNCLLIRKKPASPMIDKSQADQGKNEFSQGH